MASRRQQIEAMLANLTPDMRQAFLAALDEIRRGVILRQIADALRAGDIDAAVEAVQLDRAAFVAFEDKLREIYLQAGTTFAGDLPRTGVSGTRLLVRFDGRAPGAEEFLQVHSAQRVVQITLDQQSMIRRVLTDALQRGENPTDAVIELVGRYDARTGRRVGGFLGLTDSQSQWVINARRQLETLDSNWFTRALRDVRSDSTVRKAIESRTPLASSLVDKLIERYRSRLLALRAQTIGRTETLSALHAAQDEAYRQAVAKGLVRKQDIRRVWHTALDERVRHTHAAMEGQSVGLDEPFISPSGARLMFPGDPSGPPEEIINCRCIAETRIDFLANIRPTASPSPVVPDTRFQGPNPFDLHEEGDNEILIGNTLSNALSSDEMEAIRSYTENDYADINRDLRTGGSASPTVMVLDGIFQRAALGADIVVYRQVDQVTADTIASAATFTDRAFVSTTTDRSLLPESANVLRIEVPQGSRAIPVGAVSEYGTEEAELLLDRNTQFDVRQEGGQIVLRVRS